MENWCEGFIPLVEGEEGEVSRDVGEEAAAWADFFRDGA
jgi:hypothetical protein